MLFTPTFWTFVREFSPLGLREDRAKEETQNGESLWPNMCSPPEFLVHPCPPVHRDVTLCPASSGDAGDRWCFDRLERVPRKTDSPRLQSTSPIVSKALMSASQEEAGGFSPGPMSTAPASHVGENHSAEDGGQRTGLWKVEARNPCECSMGSSRACQSTMRQPDLQVAV